MAAKLTDPSQNYRGHACRILKSGPLQDPKIAHSRCPFPMHRLTSDQGAGDDLLTWVLHEAALHVWIWSKALERLLHAVHEASILHGHAEALLEASRLLHWLGLHALVTPLPLRVPTACPSAKA